MSPRTLFKPKPLRGGLNTETGRLMSEIDGYEHEFLGSLNGLPIYHPLGRVELDLHGGGTFECNASTLLVGGGSGEHPALVIRGLDSLVAEYLLYDLSMDAVHGHGRRVQPPETSMDELDDLAHSEKCELHFINWQMLDHRNFYQNALSPLNSTPLEAGGDAERWIRLSLGEFVYFSLPELCPDLNHIQDLAGIGERTGWRPGYWMKNVTCPPPGYMPGRHELARGFFRWEGARNDTWMPDPEPEPD
jgi:hypothetical protein